MFKQTICYLSILLLCLLFTSQMYSQNSNRIIKRNFQLEEGQSIELKLKFADKIEINGWDKNLVSLKTVVNINNGNLNEALKLKVELSDRVLRIAADYVEKLLGKSQYNDCHNKLGLKNIVIINHSTFCSKIKYEIKIPHTVELKVESIAGDIVLTELRGSIHAETISGFIDLTRSAGADLTIDSITGEAYTNIEDFQIKEKEVTGWSLLVQGLLNGGGPDVKLETISGNIYLRSDVSAN